MKDRIKEIRKFEKLTQQEFADILGIKQNTVASYEMGRIGISDAVITSICREFSVNDIWLRTGQGQMKLSLSRTQEIGAFANDIMEEIDESFKKRFVLALSKLNERDWETLEKIANALKEK